MTGTILTLAAGYGLVAALLAWLMIGSGLHWLPKALGAVATAGLIPMTYHAVGELRGVPSDQPPPPFFKLHWARVVEPNQLTEEPGRIYLWLEALDAENYPSGRPRAYALPYDDDLVRKVEAALGMIQAGEGIAGAVEAEAAETGDLAEDLAAEVRARAETAAPSAARLGDRNYRFDPSQLSFGAAPAPMTPDKPE